LRAFRLGPLRLCEPQLGKYNCSPRQRQSGTTATPPHARTLGSRPWPTNYLGGVT
jgi:hypothetical protein